MKKLMLIAASAGIWFVVILADVPAVDIAVVCGGIVVLLAGLIGYFLPTLRWLHEHALELIFTTIAALAALFFARFG